VTRKIVVLLIGPLVVGILLGQAAARPAKRVRTQAYMSPAVGVTPVHPYGTAVCNQGGVAGGNRGCVTFVARPVERFVSIEIVDTTGLPVPAFIQWDEEDNLDKLVPFCGKTKKPLLIRGTVTVWLYPYRSPNLPMCAGTATTGEVTATFIEGSYKD
jgi:hypothetical protein